MFGLARPILICKNKLGREGKFFVVWQEDNCKNYKAKKNLPILNPPVADSADVRFIPLTQGKFAIVDADDYEQLSQHKWHCRQTRKKLYAFRRKGNKMVGMHREIINAPQGFLVDHIDRDSLNNRKSNLRPCNYAQNAQNRCRKSSARSRYKGLSWQGRTKKWEVRITRDGKENYLGTFDNEIEAALAYDRKAKELFSEFAYLNFPQLGH